MTIRDTREIKATAAQRVSDAPQARQIVMIYAGISVALSALVTVVNYCLELQISQSGGLSNIGLRSILSTIQTVLPIAQALVVMCLELGLCNASLRISRGHYASPNSLRMGFDRFWPLLRCTLQQGIIYLGIFIISAYVAVQIFLITPLSNDALEIVNSLMESTDATLVLDDATYFAMYEAMIPIFPIFGIVFALIALPVFYRFRMAGYLLIDNPRYGAVLVLRESRRMMKGNCLPLLRLDLSFWWFYALNVLAGVIAYGDSLLPTLGITFPWSDTVGYFLFYGIYLVLQFGIMYLFLNRINASYALAYESLLPPKKVETGVVLGSIFDPNLQ